MRECEAKTTRYQALNDSDEIEQAEVTACVECGTQLQMGARFCFECGTKVSAASPSCIEDGTTRALEAVSGEVQTSGADFEIEVMECDRSPDESWRRSGEDVLELEPVNASHTECVEEIPIDLDDEDDDEDVDDEGEHAQVELRPVADPHGTVIAGMPERPMPFWPAPPPGNTVIGPPPRNARRTF